MLVKGATDNHRPASFIIRSQKHLCQIGFRPATTTKLTQPWHESYLQHIYRITATKCLLNTKSCHIANFSSLETSYIIIMTTYGTTNDNKVTIMTTIGFKCYSQICSIIILGRNGIYFTWVAASYRGEARGLWINGSPRECSLVKFHLSEFRDICSRQVGWSATRGLWIPHGTLREYSSLHCKNDVVMSAMASQITSLTIVYSVRKLYSFQVGK